ncbi:TRAP transporter permease [Metallumcola ferriviriculae]|uniref:TRAP transporter permease n=1 Tax=Metallumcola ferriviriculae TaxID=3039180 RepID=A0AAU0USR8_9FIRM|nr:TRAP transporter permease [Desulfitibacteraceae bacterium MK1]
MTSKDNETNVEQPINQISPNNIEEEVPDVQAILEKVDTASQFRKELPTIARWLVFVLGVTLSLFQLYTAYFGTLITNQQRGFHVAFALALVFLLYPGNKKIGAKVTWSSWAYTLVFVAISIYLYLAEEMTLLITGSVIIVLLLVQFSKYFDRKYRGIPLPDLILAALGMAVGMYQFFFYESIIDRVGIYNNTDYLFSILGVLLVMIAAERVIGAPISVLAAAMLAYAYLGNHMPQGFLSHRGFGIERIFTHSFLSMEGIFGIPIAISAQFIYLYLMLGVILSKTGLEEYFTDLAMSMTGWMVGGTAKVGILTSVFSGMITGSSVANTVGNGAFTIPMMKRSGYRPAFAAAVEAASSTGGQITPPIMGAAAFLMIEFTGLSYYEIIKAATIPAMLFFIAQFIVIHYESKRLNILGVDRGDLPSVVSLILTRGYLLLPIIVIFVILGIGQSAMRAALMGIFAALAMNIITMIVAYFLSRYGQLKYKVTIPIFFEIMEESARTALPVIAACAAAGIIAGVVTLTGLGLNVTGAILDLARNNLLLTMFFAMIASIVLGMGLPTTATYVITATMTAPALLAFDSVPLIAAHMFVFYFGIMADITPPIALASYAGAGLANANPFDTGIQSVRIAIGGFLVPYMFVLSPELVMEHASIGALVLSLATAILGMYCIGIASIGYIEKRVNVPVRILLGAAGLSLLYSGWFTDSFGLIVLASVFIHQKVSTREVRRQKKLQKQEKQIPGL